MKVQSRGTKYLSSGHSDAEKALFLQTLRAKNYLLACYLRWSARSSLGFKDRDQFARSVVLT
jgi:hypothetical protein